MDPLADRLACACVKGYAQRRYDELGAFIAARIGRNVQVVYAENLTDGLKKTGSTADLIIGKDSVVEFDAERASIKTRRIARLTGQDGSADLYGLFVVRKDDPAGSLADIKGYRTLFGPEYETEKSKAAFTALKDAGVAAPENLQQRSTCNASAVAVFEEDADLAVISSYAKPLLEGCDAIDADSLRVIARTGPVPFITVFAIETLDGKTEQKLLDALLAVKNEPALLKRMESKSGFLPITAFGSSWPDWRGPNRDGISDSVPSRLPDSLVFRWTKSMTGHGLSGIVVSDGLVIVADKDKEKKFDIFRCLSIEDGEQLWEVKYPAAGEMDYTNSPRATPVIHDGLVYLLGAFGDLHCVELKSGDTRWKKNIIKEFNAELPTWGMCSPPLIAGDKLIVNPGGKDASLVALDRSTGRLIWKTPGEMAGYSAFILGNFGGRKQIVGYDAVSLGGWDPDSGKRIWTLIPEYEGDFNVPTPISIDGKLLVATENNGTRIYEFDDKGVIIDRPIAANTDLAPDCSTPVVIDGLVFGNSGGMYCLDIGSGLKTAWVADDDEFYDYTTFIAGSGKVLAITIEGELVLLKADKNKMNTISRLKLLGEIEVWSHPALTDGAIYIRTQDKLFCLQLTQN